VKRREFITLLGGAAAWPLAAHAQQPASPVIGFLSSRSPEDSVYVLEAFRQGLRETGFVEGHNISIEFRWARGQYQQLPALAAELVNRRVAVLAAVGGDPSGIAAKQATSTIPIVFVMGDPVKAGLVNSFNRPGGNATGSVPLTTEIEPKRVGLLHELVPGVPLFGALLNPNYPTAASQLQDLEQAARTVGKRLFVAKASDDAELNAAFTSLLQQRVGALLVTSAPYFDSRRDWIIAFAAQNRLPAVYTFREYAVAGGLVSYGPSVTEAYRNSGIYAGRILKGAKPANLPIVLATKYDFVINLKTAKALGLTIPPMLLARADEVIE
jgi:putative tryptophan/tyrosine transport system substrate-binding protein